MTTATDLREGGVWTPGQRLKNDVIHAAIRVALAIAGVLPRRALSLVCRALGAVAYVALGRERRRVRRRLAAGLGRPQPEKAVRAAFRGAAEVLADTLVLLDPNEPAGKTLTLPASSSLVFRDALAEGRGVVFVSAHLGSWERMAALLAAHGFPVTTVARESYDPRLTTLYERVRGPRGVRSIYRGSPGAVRAIWRALDAGRAVGFLVDLPTRVPSVGCRVFGEDADVALGPAQIALARGTPVLVGTPAPGSDGVVVRIARIESDDAATPSALTSRLADALTERVAVMPEVWLGLFTPSKSE